MSIYIHIFIFIYSSSYDLPQWNPPPSRIFVRFPTGPPRCCWGSPPVLSVSIYISCSPLSASCSPPSSGVLSRVPAEIALVIESELPVPLEG